MKYFSTLKEKLPISMWPYTVKPQHDEPLYNKLLGKMNNFLFPSNGKTLNKNKTNDINNNALLAFHKKWLFYAIDTNYKINW